MIDYIMIQHGATQFGTPGPAFYKIIDGELVETVDVLEDGTPDWTAAGSCDATGDVLLQLTIRDILDHS